MVSMVSIRYACFSVLLVLLFSHRIGLSKPTFHSFSLEGWNVNVESAVIENESLWEEASKWLSYKLLEIRRALPAQTFNQLKEQTIWITQSDERFPGAVYHPSRDWLIDHGYPPEMEKSVHIGNLQNFLDWSREQPSMILHELAHAYHHQILGYDEPDIQSQYLRAKESGLYDQVLHASGEKKKAYALNNEQEFFAEMTEAYFGVNDFYPFVRAELKRYDPETYEMIHALWHQTPINSE